MTSTRVDLDQVGTFVRPVGWLHVRECLAPVSVVTRRKWWVCDVCEFVVIVAASVLLAALMTW